MSDTTTDKWKRNEVYVHEDDSGSSYVNQTVLVPKGRYLLVRVDEAMIERAADELAEMFGDWLGNPLGDFTPEAKRVLRAALEVTEDE